MKKVLFLLLLGFISLAYCYGQSNKPTIKNYGKSIDITGVHRAAEIPTLLAEKDSLQVKVEGNIVDVCQMRGCWMTLRIDDQTSVRVRFKDYGFFVPKDISGKTAIVQGVIKKRTVSVAELKHLAGDEGKSKAEIAAIRHPADEWTLVAEGVLVK